MKYSDVLNYLYSQLPMFQRIGAAAYKADLKNIQWLCDKLNHPEKKLKFIHIAGTNGKGSVSNMLAAIFQQNGYKTALFTSPHLIDFRERIRINGKIISKQYITKFVNTYKPLFDEVKPSFFEWTTLLAFQYFLDKKVDIVVLETGMGGRLDSTNVVLPELSIITNIGDDHKQFLGDTLQKIAYEKAGIIKPDTPVLISEYQKEVTNVFEKTAQKRNAPLIYAQDIISVQKFTHQSRYLDLYYKINLTNLNKFFYLSKNKNKFNLKKISDKSKNNFSYIEYNNLELSKNKTFFVPSPLNASYQINNIRCVLAASCILQQIGWHLNIKNIHSAIKNTPHLTGFKGRWQIVQTRPLLILDIAHNKQGIISALKNLKNYKYNQLRILFSMVKDKEVDDVLKLLPEKAIYYVTQSSVPRAIPAELLYNKFKALNLSCKLFHNVQQAIHSAKKDAHKNDLVLIFGSAFLVADALALFKLK